MHFSSDSQRKQRVALTLLLGLAFFAVVWMAAPLYVGLVIGTVMAFSAHPLYRRLAAHLHLRRTLAAALTTGLGGTLMLGSSGAVLFVVVRELVTLVDIAQQRLAGATPDSLLGNRGARLLDALHVDRVQAMARAQEELGNLSGEAARAAGVVVSLTTGAILTALIALFTMYYVTLEWPRLSTRVERVLPLDPRHTRALVTEFREVARAAFVGTIATGVVQGLLAGIGFALAGVPQAATWGVLTIIASFVPIFGPALIWSPVAVSLLLERHVGAGVFVVAWGLGIVMAFSDYVIRPRLVGGKHKGHPLLTLLGILGGIQVFGLAGLIVGPVVMALFVAILRIYEREVDGQPCLASVPRSLHVEDNRHPARCESPELNGDGA